MHLKVAQAHTLAHTVRLFGTSELSINCLNLLSMQPIPHIFKHIAVESSQCTLNTDVFYVQIDGNIDFRFTSKKYLNKFFPSIDLKSFSKTSNKNAYVSSFIFRLHDIDESAIFNGDSNFKENTNFCINLRNGVALNRERKLCKKWVVCNDQYIVHDMSHILNRCVRKFIALLNFFHHL